MKARPETRFACTETGSRPPGLSTAKDFCAASPPTVSKTASQPLTIFEKSFLGSTSFDLYAIRYSFGSGGQGRDCDNSHSDLQRRWRVRYDSPCRMRRLHAVARSALLTGRNAHPTRLACAYASDGLADLSAISVAVAGRAPHTREKQGVGSMVRPTD